MSTDRLRRVSFDASHDKWDFDVRLTDDQVTALRVLSAEMLAKQHRTGQNLTMEIRDARDLPDTQTQIDQARDRLQRDLAEREWGEGL
jgi:hypothetical protein